MDHQFRAVTFGGFHKKDVLDYLESSAQEYNRRIQQIQGRLEEAEAERERLTALESEQNLRIDRLQRERLESSEREARLRSDLEREKIEKQSLEQELERQKQIIDAQNQKRDQLEQEIEGLRPDAEAYIAIKDRAAGIELGAHRRAQRVLDEAKDQAELIQEQVEQWLCKVERDYGQLRNQVDETMERAMGELNEAGNMLDKIKGHMAEQDSILKSITKDYVTGEEIKIPIPAPLPLPEED